MPRAPNEQRYMSTAFGVLRDVHWPYRSSTVGRFEHKEAAGYVKVLRFDALPVNVRRLLGEEYLRTAKNHLGISPEDIRQHQSPGGHDILVQRLLRGQDVFELNVDPILSQHFLVAFAAGAMEYNLEGRNYLWRYMADTLAAIRLTLGVPVAVPIPLTIAHSTHAGSLLIYSKGEELRRSCCLYPACITSKSGVHSIRTLSQAIYASREHFGFVIRKLNLGAHRDRPEERLLEYVMGLEALYCADATTEPIYRLRMRCACHVGQDARERGRIFLELRDLHAIRSKIVHGTATTIEDAARNTQFNDDPIRAVDRAEFLLCVGLRKSLQEIDPGVTAEERAKSFDDKVLQMGI